MCLNPNFISRSLIDSSVVFHGHREVPGSFPVPCGKCIECVQSYSREWALRCQDELKVCNGIGCCLTLTYSEAPSELVRRDIQLFIKSLREAISPVRIRYFGCGEYGAKKQRPHFHLNIFGWRPNDLVYRKKTEKGTLLFNSVFLEKIWKRGFVVVSDLSYESCLYSAKYMQKLIDYGSMVKPFTFMSTKPGIGFGRIEDNMASDRIYRSGKVYKLPRYYCKVLERRGVDLSSLKLRRVLKAYLKRRDRKDLKIREEILKKDLTNFH